MTVNESGFGFLQSGCYHVYLQFQLTVLLKTSFSSTEVLSGKFLFYWEKIKESESIQVESGFLFIFFSNGSP